jgi:sRNA-binding regulator protein Hfq
MESSLIYSMGTALNRARDHEVGVEVLVAGQWLAGRVVDVDGHGVMLETDDFEHAVIRMDSVEAVRVHAPAPDSAPDFGAVPAQLPRL